MNFSTPIAKRELLSTAAITAFCFGLGSTAVGEEIKFNRADVRNGVFAGLAGDKEKLTRAMAACESVLAENPKHAEALVWHGIGLYSLANAAFAAGDRDKGMDLNSRGLREMEESVGLEPDNIAVRAPRGAVMLEASKRISHPEAAKRALAAGLADYERILELQQRYFESIGTHPRGELLFGLAEGVGRSGDVERASALFERIQKELPGTVYAKRADKWRLNKSLPTTETQCVGCHIK
jgi:hypothetical protein